MLGSGHARQDVYTSWVDDRPVVWDAANVKHVSADHPERDISPNEVEEVLFDATRIEVYLADRQAYQVRWPDGRRPLVGRHLDRSNRRTLPDSRACGVQADH